MRADLLFRNKSVLLLLWLTSLLLISCDGEKEFEYKPQYSSTSALKNDKEFVIGIHPLHNPQRLYEIFGPVAQYLTENIEDVSFRIEASRNYAAYNEKLYGKKFHFALPNPYQTINSLKYGYRVFGKMADDENFRGVFIVRKDSNIKSVSDLKGQAVSFPAPTALAATMMPQYFLQKHGLNVMQDIDIRYVGSQESSIMNVMLGNTRAGATWPPPWHAFLKERPELAKELMVIWETPYLINNSLIVRNDVDSDMVRKVESLLFRLHENKEGQAMLNKMELSRFEAANNDTYKPVETFLKLFNKEVRPIN